MSYPICSVVAVFKMLIRILNTLRSRIWDMTLFLFFCVLAPHGMNEIVFGERKGGGQKVVAYYDTVSTMLSRCHRQRSFSSLLKIIEYIPSGANKQKIKIVAHCKCNVRASKNAGQAFSAQ